MVFGSILFETWISTTAIPLGKTKHVKMANTKQGGTGFSLIPNIGAFLPKSLGLFACDFNNYWQ